MEKLNQIRNARETGYGYNKEKGRT